MSSTPPRPTRTRGRARSGRLPRAGSARPGFSGLGHGKRYKLTSERSSTCDAITRLAVRACYRAASARPCALDGPAACPRHLRPSKDSGDRCSSPWQEGFPTASAPPPGRRSRRGRAQRCRARAYGGTCDGRVVAVPRRCRAERRRRVPSEHRGVGRPLQVPARGGESLEVRARREVWAMVAPCSVSVRRVSTMKFGQLRVC